MAYFSGKVQVIIWDDPTRDFYILKLLPDETSDAFNDIQMLIDNDGEESINVVGHHPRTEGVPRVLDRVRGKWTTHPTHGRQVQIQRAPVVKEWTADVGVALLTTNGVGIRTAGTLRKAFDEDLCKVLDEGDERVLAEHVDLTQATHALAVWKEIKGYYQTLEFLTSVGVPKHALARIWTTFGTTQRRS